MPNVQMPNVQMPNVQISNVQMPNIKKTPIRKCYIVCRERLDNGVINMFLSSKYPCTIDDIVNIRDRLVTSFQGETFQIAYDRALDWLNQQTIRLNNSI
jgi:hypothetical protein